MSEAVRRATTSGWRLLLAQSLQGRRFVLVLPLVAAVLLVFFPSLSGGDSYWMRQIALIAVFSAVVSGINLSFGYAGEVQFGQVFMFALGAYLAAALALNGITDIVVLTIAGAAAAVVCGSLVALPALRIGGWSLAMACFYLVISIPDVVDIFESETGGLTGLGGFPMPSFLGAELSDARLYQATVIAAILWLICFRNLVTSRYGVTFRVLRQSPILASSLGFSPTRLKLQAYALGALPAGMGGVYFGFLSQYLQPTTFGLTLAIGLVAASILGGIESVYGAVIGAAILQLGPQSSLAFDEFAPVAYGIFLILAAVLLKDGIGGIVRRLARRASFALAPELRGHSAAAIAVAPENGAAATTAASPAPPAVAGRSLATRGMMRSFGGVRALDDVTIEARAGKVTGLIGSNGSGKTTLLNVICGYVKPDAGTVVLGDQDLTGRVPHRIARHRVGRTFQTPNVPRGVSVVDVVAAGRFVQDACGIGPSMFRLPRYWHTRRRDRELALVELQRVGLAHVADDEAVKLSLGTRRLVEVARALCGRPELLLLDEPASGLNDAEIRILGSAVRGAADAGMTVVLIEHNFQFVTSVSDIIHVLHLGRRIATGTGEEIAHDPLVVESYLGRPDDDAIDVHGGEAVRDA